VEFKELNLLVANIVDKIYQQKSKKSQLSIGVSFEIVSFENLYLIINKSVKKDIIKI
jgi:hypothetical protein